MNRLLNIFQVCRKYHKTICSRNFLFALFVKINSLVCNIVFVKVFMSVVWIIRRESFYSGSTGGVILLIYSSPYLQEECKNTSFYSGSTGSVILLIQKYKCLCYFTKLHYCYLAFLPQIPLWQRHSTKFPFTWLFIPMVNHQKS